MNEASKVRNLCTISIFSYIACFISLVIVSMEQNKLGNSTIIGLLSLSLFVIVSKSLLLILFYKYILYLGSVSLFYILIDLTFLLIYMNQSVIEILNHPPYLFIFILSISYNICFNCIALCITESIKIEFMEPTISQSNNEENKNDIKIKFYKLEDSMVEKDWQCMICLDSEQNQNNKEEHNPIHNPIHNMIHNPIDIIITDCNHLFHLTCIESWICKEKIIKENSKCIQTNINNEIHLIIHNKIREQESMISWNPICPLCRSVFLK